MTTEERLCDVLNTAQHMTTLIHGLRDEVRRGHETAVMAAIKQVRDALQKALCIPEDDGEKPIDHLIREVHRVTLASHDREQAEEDAEASSVIITRITSQRDVALAKLWIEVGEHAATQAMLAQIRDQREEWWRKLGVAVGLDPDSGKAAGWEEMIEAAARDRAALNEISTVLGADRDMEPGMTPNEAAINAARRVVASLSEARRWHQEAIGQRDLLAVELRADIRRLNERVVLLESKAASR